MTSRRLADEGAVAGAEQFAAFLDAGINDIDTTAHEAEYRLLWERCALGGAVGLLDVDEPGPFEQLPVGEVGGDGDGAVAVSTATPAGVEPGCGGGWMVKNAVRRPGRRRCRDALSTESLARSTCTVDDVDCEVRRLEALGARRIDIGCPGAPLDI